MKRQDSFLTAAEGYESKCVTISDYYRITNHIEDDIGKNDVDPHILHQLYLALNRCRKYYSEEIPENIVTMNSELSILTEENDEKTIKIVYPEDVTKPENISVYSSLGLACLGRKEGSKISYYEDDVFKTAVIKKITFQPEKEKLYNL